MFSTNYLLLGVLTIWMSIASDITIELQKPIVDLPVASSLPPDSLLALHIATIKGKSISLEEFTKNKATVLIFLSADCPLSQNYTLPLNKLYERYKEANIAFYAVFPGNTEKKGDIKAFLKTYHVKFDALLDTKLYLTQAVQATVTPEVYLVNQRGNIVYSGMVDNWAYALGKKRAVITEHYLEDGLNAVVNGLDVKVKKTEAVGCYINSLN